MTAYRDHHAVLRDVAQHLAIAFRGLEHVRSLDLRLAQPIVGRPTEAIRAARAELVYEANSTWAAAWDQLVSARALVVAIGRPTHAFDELRAACGMTPSAEPRRGRFRSWTGSPTDRPFAAIQALATAVPEAPCMIQPGGDEDFVNVRAKLHPAAELLLVALGLAIPVVLIAALSR